MLEDSADLGDPVVGHQLGLLARRCRLTAVSLTGRPTVTVDVENIVDGSVAVIVDSIGAVLVDLPV